MDRDRLPPVLELKISPESWSGPVAFSQKRSLKIPPIIEWYGDEYACMGFITRRQGLRGEGKRFTAQVVIDEHSYSYEGDTLNPVEPNLFDHYRVIEIPGGSFLSTQMDADGVMPLRFYYTRKKGETLPTADRTGSHRLHRGSSPVSGQKPRRRHPGGRGQQPSAEAHAQLGKM